MNRAATIFRSFLLILMMFSLTTSLGPLYAQSSTGSITGTVLDSTGGALPGAAVTATNTDTSAARTTTSTGRGTFTLPLLQPGGYSVSADLSGFSAAKVTDVRVSVGGDATVKLVLEPAGVQAAVTVSGEAPLIETTRSQVSSVVGERFVANLPVNGRNFIDFVLTTPGVVKDVRLGDISFAGQRGTLNSLIVDGSDNNNTFFGQALGRTGSGRAPYQFSQDGVKEFQVNTNAYSAEYGRAGGAVVNVVTKSGTNELHGSGFYYYRDRKLNENDYINLINNRPKGPYHFDQFGGSLGGPIVRDRFFFFGSYDGQRNTIPNVVVLNIPAGTPSDADTLAGIARLRPLAESWERGQDQDVFLLKSDYEVTSNSRLTVRYNRQDFTGLNFESGGITNSIEHTGNSLVETDTVSASLTNSFSPRIFNELRGQYARDHEPGKANSSNPEATIRQVGQNVLVIGRNFFSPRETTIKRYQIADTATLLFGNHTFKAGADYNKDDILNFFPGNFSGSYTFSSIAQFQQGRPATYVQAFPGEGTTGPTTHPDLTDIGVFLQDEWRVARNFTLNLGARYDYQEINQPSVKNPDPQLAAAGTDTSSIAEDGDNYAARLGFAWTPPGSDRTVVRGGYGIFYGRTLGILVGTAHSNNGISVQTITFTGTQVPTYPNTFPSVPTGVALPRPTILVFDRDFESPQVHQASVGVEHSLFNDLAVGLNYLHVRGKNLPRSIDINVGDPVNTTLPIAGGGTATFRQYPTARPLSNFARVIEFQSSADSEYDGLTLEVNKRFSHSWLARLAYTYGKVEDNRPDATAVVPQSSDDAKFAQDPKDLDGDWGPGDNDVRHRVVLSGVWDLNYAGGIQNGFLQALASGWTLSGILTVQTGQPYSALINTDLNRDGNTRNDRAPGFERNTFRLPTQVTFDPRISRHILIGPVDLELIAEAFNVFDRSNVSFVRTTYYSLVANQLVFQDNFGSPTSSSGPRIIQLAAKVTF